MSSLSLAILQRVCTPYRVALFRRLAARSDLRVRLFIGDDLPGSKVRNASDLSGLDVVRLPTRWLRVGARSLPVHRGLSAALRDFDPDVILSEGDSHPLGFLTASRVRDQRVDRALVHWGLGGLPGRNPGAARSRARRLLVQVLKRGVHGRADAFLCYSSYGANALVALGRDRDAIVVAVNVSDTDRQLETSASLAETRAQARATLGLPDRFGVLAVGALDANKRIGVLLDAVAGLDVEAVILGEGPELAPLRARVRSEPLANVRLVGAVPSETVARYYRAADVLVVPGRGGMVISEAMAHALPIVVHQADGTEYDLVHDGETGLRLAAGDHMAFRNAIVALMENPDACERMGAAGRRLIETELNPAAMVERIVEVCQLARARRTATPSS